jgi:hypothetical protein
MDSADDLEKLNKKIEGMADERVFTDDEIEHLKQVGLIKQDINKKGLLKKSLEFFLKIKEILVLSIVGTYLLVFYFEKRINPDFTRDILYLSLLKIGDGITTSHRKKFLRGKAEEARPYPRKETEDSEIDKKISADISRSLLFLIIPGVLILYFYSTGKNDNFIYSSGIFFIYFVFSLGTISNLWSIFRTGKRLNFRKSCEIEYMNMCSVIRDIKSLNHASCNECEIRTDKRVIKILKNIKNAKRPEDFYGLQGDCGILALAIQEILGEGYLVAMGDEGRAEGYMQHAGLLYKGIILDVNGLSNKDFWIDQWTDDKSTKFMDEVTEYDIFRGTCPKNTHGKYLTDLSNGIE